MIRYEIFSNVAATEQGLRNQPVLQDLADSLAVKDIETRFIKQVTRVESEINVASAKHAKGVTVKEKTVKTLHPQTNLKGCLAWLKNVTARVDRGLHIEVERVRATNGAGLVFGQLFGRGQRAFLTGMENGNWERLTAQADLSLAKVPPEIVGDEELKNEYRARGTRPGSFFGALEQVGSLLFLPGGFRAQVKEILKTRDAQALTRFSEAQIINIGLISDVMVRYQNLLEQFYELVDSGGLGGDLSPLFSFLTQGIEYTLLYKLLAPFTLEIKRDRIKDKRGLINEIRIGLARSDSARNQRFQGIFTSIVIRERAMRDPGLYGQAVRLDAADPEETEVMGSARVAYRELEGNFEKLAKQKVDPSTPAPSALKQMLFEMVVGLAYQAEYTVRHREDAVPKRANLAREILETIGFGVFDTKILKTLNPKMPVKGVAGNLSGKIPLTAGQFATIMETLRAGLLPMAGVVEELSKNILSKYKDQEAQQKTEALNAYLHNAYPLLRNTYYLLGTDGRAPSLRAAALSGGHRLGLTVLSARDQIKNREVLTQLSEDPDLRIEGYISLMTGDEKSYVPVKTDLEILSRAYRFLFTERVVHLVRRFAFRKINYLLETHGSMLFEAIYQHLLWERQLPLSRYQLGMILYRQKVFDVQRLKQFGFKAGGMENGHERDNPWLHSKDEATEEEQDDNIFVAGRIEKECQAARDAFNGFLKKCGEIANGHQNAANETLAGKIFEMAQEGLLDPHDEKFREGLAGTKAAKALWGELEEITAKNFQTIIPPDTEGEAIEFTFPGPLAYLTLLKDSHLLKIEDKEFRFRLQAAPDQTPASVNAHSRIMVKGLSERLVASSPSARIRIVKPALELMQTYSKLWGKLRQIGGLLLIDQMLQESIITLARPAAPTPRGVASIAPEKVLCLGTSSSDVGKFHKMTPGGKPETTFATLSQLANWLIRFTRLRDEMEEYRDIIRDVREIIASFNVSVFDAPHILRYSKMLGTLREVLDIRPEDMGPEDLTRIERTALETEQLTREIFDSERSFAPKDRWLNRITVRLKKLHPNLDLTFPHRLYEKAVAENAAENKENKQEEARDENTRDKRRSDEQFQTFSERVRNVIEYHHRINAKSVFVISPAHSQRRLTLNLIDQLFRVKGLFTPILADISGCANFVDELRHRLPPHRIFNINNI